MAPGTWTYRRRLRREGFALAASGLTGSVALMVAVLLGVLGPRSVRRWARAAAPTTDPGNGEPTPLWQLPAICAGLALLVVLLTGAWDAALRVTGGCLLVGLAQALLLERVVAAEERRRGGTLVRLPGSRILRGTRLGVVPAPRPPG